MTTNHSIDTSTDPWTSFFKPAKTLKSCFFSGGRSVGADSEHRGRGEQEDGGGRVSVLQTGSGLHGGVPENTRDTALPLPLLPRRTQEQQGTGTAAPALSSFFVSIIALIHIQGEHANCPLILVQLNRGLFARLLRV